MFRTALIALISVVCVISSCEKAESPINLPQRGSTTHSDPVDMGGYKDQVFYSLRDNKVVFISTVREWDLAFEASPTGFHIRTNSPKYEVYNTKETDFYNLSYNIDNIDMIETADWDVDVMAGGLDSTVIGDWTLPGGNSKGEVYILKRAKEVNVTPDQSDSFYVLRIKSVSPEQYIIEFRKLESNTAYTKIVPKDDNYNYTYYSFWYGVTYTEPAKNTWDIVFTQYAYPFHDYGINYSVTGALLNPYKTRGALLDSAADFRKADVDVLRTIQLTEQWDVIGYDWKILHFNQSTGGGTYSVNKNKVYIINDQHNYYWKFHFLDFYNENGEKGCPSFEFERLQ